MMSAFFHFQPALNSYLKIVLSYIGIRLVLPEISWGGGVKLTSPRKKLPSKRSVLLGSKQGVKIKQGIAHCLVWLCKDVAYCKLE